MGTTVSTGGSFVPLLAIADVPHPFAAVANGSSWDPLTHIMLYLGRPHVCDTFISLSEFSGACVSLRRTRDELLRGQRGVHVEFDKYGLLPCHTGPADGDVLLCRFRLLCHICILRRVDET